jgi:hypothetical protein
LETELLLEFVDAELMRLPCPLQDTKGDETTGHMRHLGPLGAGLTAGEAQLILADADHFHNWCADARQAAYLRGREREAIRGIVLGDVSDHQHFEAPTEPANGGPVRVPPIVTDRVPIEATSLLETADKIPAIVTNALEQGFRGLPGIQEPRGRATAQVIAGIAEHLQGQRIF